MGEETGGGFSLGDRRSVVFGDPDGAIHHPIDPTRNCASIRPNQTEGSPLQARKRGVVRRW